MKKPNNKIVYILLALSTLTPWVTPAMSLFAGILFAVFFTIPNTSLNKSLSNKLLKWSVVFLGFGLNAVDAMKTGSEGSLVTFSSIALTLGFGAFLGKKLGLDKTIYRLIASGTAICGGSAIAAMAPALRADDKQISVAMATVFILNAVALVVFPVIGNHFDLTQTQFGWWAALAIHDTSAVVGAAAKYGDEALKIATTVKLTRALWIVPISLIASFSQKGKMSLKTMPTFIIGFVIAMLINSYVPGAEAIAPFCKFIAHKGLSLALFTIGCTMDVSSLKHVGTKPMYQGIALWVVISSLSLVTVMYLF